MDNQTEATQTGSGIATQTTGGSGSAIQTGSGIATQTTSGSAGSATQADSGIATQTTGGSGSAIQADSGVATQTTGGSGSAIQIGSGIATQTTGSSGSAIQADSGIATQTTGGSGSTIQIGSGIATQTTGGSGSAIQIDSGIANQTTGGSGSAIQAGSGIANQTTGDSVSATQDGSGIAIQTTGGSGSATQSGSGIATQTTGGEAGSATQTSTGIATQNSWGTQVYPDPSKDPKPKQDDRANQTKEKSATTLPLFALNHISFLVQDVSNSAYFYEKVMGFVIIKRPDVFDYEGIWMFGHGVSLHLLGQGQKPVDNKSGNKINPIDNHISFQCSNLYSMLRVLQTSKVNFDRFQTKIDGKIVVCRINFYDPDGHMIEIADSQNLPIVPLSDWPPKSMPTPNLEFITTAATAKEMTCKSSDKCTCDDDKAEELFDLENITSQHHFLAMSHVGYLCTSLEKSLKFYKEVLGFVSIEVPKDENWNKEIKRAWLFGHGIGIHLMQKDCACPRPIDPQDSGIAFQCTNMYYIITRLEEKDIKYVAKDIKEDGIIVNEIFFHDPDGNMIEFCTLQNLPIVLISECPPKKMPTPNLNPSKKELPCKPKWPPCKCNKVEEDCYEICCKVCKPKVICKPKVVKCCEEIVTCDTMQEELKSCAIQK